MDSFLYKMLCKDEQWNCEVGFWWALPAQSYEKIITNPILGNTYILAFKNVFGEIVNKIGEMHMITIPFEFIRVTKNY